MGKKIYAAIIFVLFEILICFSLFLYSRHVAALPWGDIKDRGDLLLFIFMIAPVLVLLSVLKVFLGKQYPRIRYSYFLYVSVVIALGWCCVDRVPQWTYALTSLVILIVAILNIMEMRVFFKAEPVVNI